MIPPSLLTTLKPQPKRSSLTSASPAAQPLDRAMPFSVFTVFMPASNPHAAVGRDDLSDQVVLARQVHDRGGVFLGGAQAPCGHQLPEAVAGFLAHLLQDRVEVLGV